MNRVPACRPSAAGVPLRDRHRAMEILASRMLLRPADYQRSLSFYRDQIGLAIAREYGAGTVFFAGQSLLELAGYGEPDHSRGPFPARCGCRCATSRLPRPSWSAEACRSLASPAANRGACTRCM